MQKVFQCMSEYNYSTQVQLFKAVASLSRIKHLVSEKRWDSFQELQMVATFTTLPCREPKLGVRLHSWSPSLLYINQQCMHVQGIRVFTYAGHLNQLSFLPYLTNALNVMLYRSFLKLNPKHCTAIVSAHSLIFFSLGKRIS